LKKTVQAQLEDSTFYKALKETQGRVTYVEALSQGLPKETEMNQTT
jgi:hypothetical protein